MGLLNQYIRQHEHKSRNGEKSQPIERIHGLTSHDMIWSPTRGMGEQKESGMF
jgi:hypothetical protein